MPDITIEHTTFERLQQNAKPFVDTPDTVINRALDALEKLKAPMVLSGSQSPSEREIDPRIIPNLTHTKVVDASIDGEAIQKPNWNLLLDLMLIRAMNQYSDLNKVQKLCPINMVKGCKEDEGYRHLPDIDISVQGLDANTACRTVVGAAKGLGIELDIGFLWRPNDKAAYPGERGRLRVPVQKSQAV